MNWILLIFQQLAVLLLTLAVSWTSVQSGNAESTNEELMKRAASQLERLSAFRRPREPPITLPEVPSEENGSQSIATEAKVEEEMVEAQKRIDDLRASATAVLQDPRYAAIMQDRIKRSFISGFANKLIGGAVGAVSGLSRGVSGLSSSNSPSEYGYGHSVSNNFPFISLKKGQRSLIILKIVEVFSDRLEISSAFKEPILSSGSRTDQKISNCVQPCSTVSIATQSGQALRSRNRSFIRNSAE